MGYIVNIFQLFYFSRNWLAFSTKSIQVMATGTTTTDASSTDDEYVKSRQENGRYVNSFNKEFKLPDFSAVLRWKCSSKDNTNLPPNAEELDRVLPVRHPKPDEIVKKSPGLRFIWIGHATCLVQIDDFIFITDPVFSERCGITSFIGPKRYRPPALTVNDLPEELDAVVISHNHYDHLDHPSVQSLHQRYGNKLTWYCGLGLAEWFRSCNIENVIELDWWQDLKHEVRYFIKLYLLQFFLLIQSKQHVTIAFCPAQHWYLYLYYSVVLTYLFHCSRSRRSVFDVNQTLWGGYAVWNAKHRFYFAGDTGYTHNISIFRQIGKKYGPFDLSAIPIGAYEPRWMMEGQHVSPDEAVQIHLDTQSKKSIGIHWGTWALAHEFYLEPINKLSDAIKSKQLNSDSFIVLQHGEILDLPKNN